MKTCSICNHPKVAEINEHLLGVDSNVCPRCGKSFRKPTARNAHMSRSKCKAGNKDSPILSFTGIAKFYGLSRTTLRRHYHNCMGEGSHPELYGDIGTPRYLLDAGLDKVARDLREFHRSFANVGGFEAVGGVEKRES